MKTIQEIYESIITEAKSFNVEKQEKKIGKEIEKQLMDELTKKLLNKTVEIQEYGEETVVVIKVKALNVWKPLTAGASFSRKNDNLKLYDAENEEFVPKVAVPVKINGKPFNIEDYFYSLLTKAEKDLNKQLSQMFKNKTVKIDKAYAGGKWEWNELTTSVKDISWTPFSKQPFPFSSKDVFDDSVSLNARQLAAYLTIIDDKGDKVWVNPGTVITSI